MARLAMTYSATEKENNGFLQHIRQERRGKDAEGFRSFLGMYVGEFGAHNKDGEHVANPDLLLVALETCA